MNTTKKRLRIIVFSILWVAVATLAAQAETQKGEERMTITPGKSVSIEYTLTLEDKKVVDTNVGGEPLTYVQGSSQIIPGLETAMEGLKVGDTKQVKVNPEEGYGPVIQEAIVEVETEQLPEGARRVDAQVQAQSPDGQILRGQVTELKDGKAVVDFNHPLEGKILVFDVKVLDIQ